MLVGIAWIMDHGSSQFWFYVICTTTIEGGFLTPCAVCTAFAAHQMAFHKQVVCVCVGGGGEYLPVPVPTSSCYDVVCMWRCLFGEEERDLRREREETLLAYFMDVSPYTAYR